MLLSFVDQCAQPVQIFLDMSECDPVSCTNSKAQYRMINASGQRRLPLSSGITHGLQTHLLDSSRMHWSTAPLTWLSVEVHFPAYGTVYSQSRALRNCIIKKHRLTFRVVRLRSSGWRSQFLTRPKKLGLVYSMLTCLIGNHHL